MSGGEMFEGVRSQESGVRSQKSEISALSKQSDKWYTPPSIQDLIAQVLGAIDLDPCADDGKHIAAAHHFTAADDGLSQEWHGRVFMNPPYSCPGKWIAKLQAEYESGRVTEAIALVPASTDTNWLSPLLDSQPVCFWKGRIKFLDTSYQPKQSARQSHCLIYWGNNSQKFKEVFNEVGIVKNVDSWNPADFGAVDYKADGDQMTIFCEDNEPPAPDDYPTIADYEQAWAEWESTNKQEDKTMTTFQFSATSEIAEQIAQLQEQLNQLTTSLKPYQECEQKAEELRREVAEFGHEMTAKGIPQDDIFLWAKSLYSAASCVEFVEGDSSVIAAQNEVIAELKAELERSQRLRYQAESERLELMGLLEIITVERNEALDKVVDVTAGNLRVTEKLKTLQERHVQVLQEVENLKEQTDTATIEVLLKEQTDTATIEVLRKEQQLMPEVEVLKQQVFEAKLNPRTLLVGDRVAVVDADEDDNLEYLIGMKGTVVGVKGDSVAVLFSQTIEFDEHELVLPSRYLEFQADITAQIKGREFIASIKTKSGMNNLTWQDIGELCQGNYVVFREIMLSATTKVQKDFISIDNLSRLMADYIMETGDITDFGWLDDIFVAKVEALVEAKKSLAYHKGDWVRVLETGVIWQVRSFDGEWLNAILDNKITSLHKSEVELMPVEIAA